MHDFVPRAKEWYTNQTCDALLEVFSDVLPRARNVIRTMEYSRGDLKGQVCRRRALLWLCSILALRENSVVELGYVVWLCALVLLADMLTYLIACRSRRSRSETVI